MALEIRRRSLGWSVVKLVVGALFAAGTVHAFLNPPQVSDRVELWMGKAMMLAIASSCVAMVISNAWLLVRRPIVLRATDDGVWFGAGPVIPWRDVSHIYESGMFWSRYGHSGHTPSVSFSFHRTRIMFKLPPFLWFTTIHFGDVRISVANAEDPPHVLVTLLERLRGPRSQAPVELPQAKISGR